MIKKSDGEKEMDDMSIVVMSCDKYEDCWNPYMQCLHKFWPECSYPTVLCSESKDSDMFDKCILSGSTTWSERLLNALDNLDNKYVLFTLDDFWLSQIVDDKKIKVYISCFENNPKIGVIYLDENLKTKCDYADGLQEIPFETAYRVNAGPAIWKVNALRSVIRKEESAWDFERMGSYRSEGKEFIALQTEKSEWKRVFAYGAVERGKWDKRLSTVLQNEGIDVNLGNRRTKDNMDYAKGAVKSFIYNLNPTLIVKVQNWIYKNKGRDNE